jgi:hypothetical protein
MRAAALNGCVEDRAALARLGMPDKKPVSLPDRRWPDLALARVGVERLPPVLQVRDPHRPRAQRVANRAANPLRDPGQPRSAAVCCARLRANGYQRRVAITAVMRKLVILLSRLLKNPDFTLVSRHIFAASK